MPECISHPDAPVQGEYGVIWNALRYGKIWITRGKGGKPFEFAAGTLAEVKGDASRLRRSPLAHTLVLGAMAAHPCLKWADVLAPVPNGMIGDAEALGERLGKEVIRLYRPDGASSRYDIRFVGKKDRLLAAEATSVCEIEDLTSTGSTPYAEANILREINPGLEVHTLSILHRAAVMLEYLRGSNAVVYHTLCATSRAIPLDYDEFVAAFGIIPELVGADEE